MDPFVMPEDLTTLTDEELASTEADALAAFDALNQIDPADLSEEQVAQMEALAGHVATIRAEGQTRSEAATARADRARAAAAAIAEPEAETAEEGEAEEGAEEGEPEEAEPGQEPDQAVAAEVVAEAEAIAASAQRRSPPSLVRSTRVANPTPAGNPRVAITAGADIKGIPTGSSLENMLAVAKAFQARSDGFPQVDTPDLYLKHNVATFSRGKGSFQGLTHDNPDYKTFEDLLDAAADQSRLKGGALLAAGGWCAPSENLYDLCASETLDGIVDLPEINVPRGGINFTTGPEFADIYADVGFCQTEAQAIAGTAKACYTVECPPFEEVRLDACGICIEVPLLTRSAFPELVRRVLDGSFVAHQHKINAKMIAAMQTAIGAATAITTEVGSAAADVLGTLALAATGLRYVYRLSQTATLEVVAPFWLKEVVRQDLELRTGQDGPVTDGQIDAWFAARNLAIQWVYGYQDITAKCPTAFAASAEVMIYPAGTFVKGTNDIISLDTVYDSTNLKQNIYTGAFFEEGVLLAQRCFSACRYTIDLCAMGRTGAADLTCAVGP